MTSSQRNETNLRLQWKNAALVLQKNDGLAGELGHDLAALLTVTDLLDAVTVQNLHGQTCMRNYVIRGKRLQRTSGAPLAHFWTSSKTFVARSFRVRFIIFLLWMLQGLRERHVEVDSETAYLRFMRSSVRHLFVPGISRSRPALTEWSIE